MKLLLDNNSSPRLVRRLGDLYPGTTHVRALNLQSAADERIWHEAATGGFIILPDDIPHNDAVVLAEVIRRRMARNATSQHAATRH